MAQRPKDDEAMPVTPGRRFSKFLTIDQVAEILNVNNPRSPPCCAAAK